MDQNDVLFIKSEMIQDGKKVMSKKRRNRGN